MIQRRVMQRYPATPTPGSTVRFWQPIRSSNRRSMCQILALSSHSPCRPTNRPGNLEIDRRTSFGVPPKAERAYERPTKFRMNFFLVDRPRAARLHPRSERRRRDERESRRVQIAMTRRLFGGGTPSRFCNRPTANPSKR